MQKIACITLDLESDHAGRIHSEPLTWKKQQMTQLINICRKHHVQLSVFVVGRMLNKENSLVNALKRFGADFYLHSNSHDINNPDSAREILQGRQQFFSYFRHLPLGYRAPEGRISISGMRRLKKYGFVFDASVFPSFWPAIKYMGYPNIPYKDSSGLVEIPNTTVSPAQLIFTLSWIKLFGWKFYELIISRYNLPNLVVFSFHLHDLWRSPRFNQLPIFWKFIYKNNQQNGMQYLENILEFLSSHEYKFTTLNHVAKSLYKGKTH